MTTPTLPAAAKSASTDFDAFIFAGGGSGGHLFPGLAIAERLIEQQSTARILFLCADRAIDRSILTRAQVRFQCVKASPFAFRPFPSAPLKLIRGWSATGRQVRQAIQSFQTPLSRIRIIALGGFVAAPIVRTGSRMGCRILLVNLDAVPGRANVLMARWTGEIVSATPVLGYPQFAGRIVGIPLRRAALASVDAPASRTALGLDPNRRTLLITGASQGSGAFNDLLIDICEHHAQQLSGWQFIHLCGADKAQQDVIHAFSQAGLRAVVLPFCDRMDLAWGSATLALSRAGASSVAEAIANRVPTLFAPYPWHKDQHQRRNAQPWVDRRLAWLVQDSMSRQRNLSTIGEPLLNLMGTEFPQVEQVKAGLTLLNVPDAARVIADLARSGDLNDEKREKL